MTSINQILKMCWSIINKTADEKTKLQALALVNECTKHKVKLSTNGVIVTDAIKYVNGKIDNLNNQEKKLLHDIKEDKEEETTTTNGIF